MRRTSAASLFRIRIANMTFEGRDARFEPETLTLRLPDPLLGELTFGVQDDLMVSIMDLEIPTQIRNALTNQGWDEMPMAAFLELLAAME